MFLSGKISPWTGRFYSLLDPSYAKNNIPIIASVSEHQPTTWSSYYFDLQLLVFMFPGKLAETRDNSIMLQHHCSIVPLYLPPVHLSCLPVGLYYCFNNLSDARIFIIMYGVTSMYFSAVMVRVRQFFFLCFLCFSLIKCVHGSCCGLAFGFFLCGVCMCWCSQYSSGTGIVWGRLGCCEAQRFKQVEDVGRAPSLWL